MINPTVNVSIAQPTLALVSDATVFVDGEGHPGVITVQRFEDDIEIKVLPLIQLPYPLRLEIVLDSTDLAHIKSLLDAQDRATAEQPDPPDPSDAPCYDCRTTGERLAEIEQRLDALEKWQKAVAMDSAEDDTLFRIYDTIARRERGA